MKIRTASLVVAALAAGSLGGGRLSAEVAGLAEIPAVGDIKEAGRMEKTPAGYASAFIPFIDGIDPETGEVLVRLTPTTTLSDVGMLMMRKGELPSFWSQLQREAKAKGIVLSEATGFRVVSGDLPERYQGKSVDELAGLVLPAAYYSSDPNGPYGSSGGGLAPDPDAGGGHRWSEHLRTLRPKAFASIDPWLEELRDAPDSGSAPPGPAPSAGEPAPPAASSAQRAVRAPAAPSAPAGGSGAPAIARELARAEGSVDGKATARQLRNYTLADLEDAYRQADKGKVGDAKRLIRGGGLDPDGFTQEELDRAKRSAGWMSGRSEKAAAQAIKRLGAP